MKRLIAFAMFVLLMVMSVSASAEKKQWCDNSFKFSQTNSIYIEFMSDIPLNDIDKHIASETYAEKRDSWVQDMKKKGYKIFTPKDVRNSIQIEQGIDIEELGNKDVEAANRIWCDYILTHCDVGVYIALTAYGNGSEYVNGYTINTPNTTVSNVYTSNGDFGTITTYGTTQQYIPGGYAGSAYAHVDFYVVNHKDKSQKYGVNVWMLSDDRVKVNKTMLDNTEPKDLFERMLSSFFSEANGKFGKKAK